MKNIVIVIDSLTGGGAERVMITLATELISQGNKVTILSLSNRCDYLIPVEIKVCYLFNHKASKVDRHWRIKASVNKLESWFLKEQSQYSVFDLVLSNLDRSNNLLAKSTIPNVYYIIHNSVEEELKRQKKLGIFSYWYLLKSKKNLSGKNLVTVSRGIAEEVYVHKRITPKSMRTIYNPFDLDDIRKKSLLVNKDIPIEPYIIHVGRLAKQKRHDILFKAFDKVDKRIKLVLLCNKPKKALALAKKYGIEERIILPGFQSNPYNWIRNAKALVLSSDYEGLPTVLLEALFVETKVVSTDCPHGPSEILTGNLSKYLVPIREPEKLSFAINKALEDDIQLKSTDILAKISAKQIAKQYLSLI